MLASIIFMLACVSLSQQKAAGPEMSFQPLPPKRTKFLFFSEQPTIIRYKKSDTESVKSWTDTLDNFLKAYTIRDTVHNVDCDGKFGKVSSKDVCNVDLRSFGPCSAENNYGYNSGRPCVFLTFIKKQNWMPEFYNASSDLPEQMPSFLKDIIRNEETQRHRTDYVWTTCEAASPEDEQNLGPTSYYPRAGFPSMFFPYKGQDGYLSPLVAVQLESPKPGTLVRVRCKAWARNIIHCNDNQIGTVHFEFFIEE